MLEDVVLRFQQIMPCGPYSLLIVRIVTLQMHFSITMAAELIAICQCV